MKLFCVSVLCVLASVALLVESLQCYDCDPTTEGECVDPVKRNAKVTFCDHTSTNIQLRALTPPKRTCFSIQYKSNNGGNDGIYRGCLVYPSSEEPCENLKKQVSKGQVESCTVCEEDRCNTQQPGPPRYQDI